MGALDPIAGISLERYAELAAKMKDCGGDLEVCARIAADEGVDRATWQAAMDGWNHRMNDPSTAGEVALAYMPLYQAALASTGALATSSFEEYVGMSVLLKHPRFGLEVMYAYYGIDTPKWSQISTYWVDQLTRDQALAQRFSSECAALKQRLDEGGAPPPPRQGERAQPSAAEVVAAAGAVADLPPVAVGQNAYVLWSDQQKYAAHVLEAGGGKCRVRFPNGREEWIPYRYVTGS